MKNITTVTKKGQVTIPVMMRKKLQISSGDKIRFSLNKQGKVVLEPVKNDLDDLYGALSKERPEMKIEEQRKTAREWIGNQKGRA